MALADWISLVGFIIAFLGSILGIVNLVYTRERTKVIGPKINIPYVEFEDLKEGKSGTGLRLTILFQNVGDRVSFVMIRRITLKQVLGDKEQKSIIVQPSIDEDGLMFQAQSQIVKSYDMKVPLTREELKDSEVMVATIYTDHIGNLIEKGWRFKIDSELVGNLEYVWRNEKILEKEQRRLNFSQKRFEQTYFKDTEETEKTEI